MSLPVYLLCWFAYFVSAAVLFRVFLAPHLPVWFPNSTRIARILLLVVLFSPTVLVEDGELSLAPALLVLLMQLLAKSLPGMLKAMLPWLLFGGITLLVDASQQSDRCPDDKR